MGAMANRTLQASYSKASIPQDCSPRHRTKELGIFLPYKVARTEVILGPQYLCTLTLMLEVSQEKERNYIYELASRNN